MRRSAMAWSESALDEIFERQCHLCGGRVKRSHYGHPDSRHAWEVDHDHPRALGGPDDLENLRPAHPWCNRSKGAMPSEEYRELLAIGDEETDETPELGPIAEASIMLGALAAVNEPDPQKRFAAGAKMALGSAAVLTVLCAVFD